MYSDRTNLPPLTLAVVVLEQTLVVGDTVLAEHETIVEKHTLVIVIIHELAAFSQSDIHGNWRLLPRGAAERNSGAHGHAVLDGIGGD